MWPLYITSTPSLIDTLYTQPIELYRSHLGVTYQPSIFILFLTLHHGNKKVPATSHSDSEGDSRQRHSVRQILRSTRRAPQPHLRVHRCYQQDQMHHSQRMACVQGKLFLLGMRQGRVRYPPACSLQSLQNPPHGVAANLLSTSQFLRSSCASHSQAGELLQHNIRLLDLVYWSEQYSQPPVCQGSGGQRNRCPASCFTQLSYSESCIPRVDRFLLQPCWHQNRFRRSSGRSGDGSHVLLCCEQDRFAARCCSMFGPLFLRNGRFPLQNPCEWRGQCEASCKQSENVRSRETQDAVDQKIFKALFGETIDPRWLDWFVALTFCCFHGYQAQRYQIGAARASEGRCKSGWLCGCPRNCMKNRV